MKIWNGSCEQCVKGAEYGKNLGFGVETQGASLPLQLLWASLSLSLPHKKDPNKRVKLYYAR